MTLASRLRNALFILFIGGILAYGTGFAVYMLARFDLVNLIRDVNGDDAFYYFQIARNLAEGKFSTFDGGITQTNGYHPLWMLLITPFYWVFDKEAALFAIKAFEIMLIAGGVALVAAAARLARLPYIALFVLFIGLAPTSVPASDPTATSTPAAKTVGLFLNEPEAFDGYTLFNKRHSETIYLIDNQGREVHRWELGIRTAFARLLENGNLLTFAITGQGRYVREVDRNGNILSDCTQGSPHHDFLKMPNGNVLLLSRQRKTPEEVIAAGANPDFIADGLRVPHIVEVKFTGPANCEIVWEWSAWDHLIQDFDSSKANYGVVAKHPELIDLNFRLSEVAGSEAPFDWIHSNGIDYNPALDQIMLSPRHFSEVWIIDHSTTRAEAAGSSGGNSGKGGDLLYRWGNPRAYRAGTLDDQQLFWPHIIRNGFPPDWRGPATSSFSTMALSSRISGAIIRR